MSKLWMKRQKRGQKRKAPPRAAGRPVGAMASEKVVASSAYGEMRVNVTSGDERCDHGLRFDEAEAEGLSASEVRRRFPRLFGDCPKGCGFRGIAYVSMHHFYAGSW